MAPSVQVHLAIAPLLRYDTTANNRFALSPIAFLRWQKATALVLMYQSSTLGEQAKSRGLQDFFSKSQTIT